MFTTPLGEKKKNNKRVIKKDNRINLEKNEEKSLDKRVPWAYVAKNSRGKKIKGYFYAYNKRDVEYFLESEELEIVSVKTSKTIQMLNHGFRRNKKLKTKKSSMFDFFFNVKEKINQTKNEIKHDNKENNKIKEEKDK